MSFAIVFRAQQFSLGAEGQLYFGALVSGIIALNSHQYPRHHPDPIYHFGFGHRRLHLRADTRRAQSLSLNANELVSTLMLNVIATRFFEMVLNFQLKPADAAYVASEKFGPNAILPVIVENTQVHDRGVRAGDCDRHLLAAHPPDAA